MADDFVVTGTRPPSAAGTRPMTASSKDFGYYTKKPNSTVDETLFKPHHTSILHAPVTFAAPWEKKLTGKDKADKKTKPGRPLLWAPLPSDSHVYHKDNNNNNHSNKSARSSADDNADTSQTFGTINGIPMKHQYRRLKHTPTFVDESLFGTPLKEPSFKAPWEEKKKVKQMYNWYPQQQEEQRPNRRRRRPATALGLRGFSVTSGAVPVWKP